MNSNLRTLEKSRKPKLPQTGEIINFYEHIPKKYIEKSENPNESVHNIKLPFRMCIVAPSGSGKTNFLLNLIKVFSQGKGTFADITIVTMNKDEPLYNYLAGEYDQIKIVEGMHSTPKLDDFDKKYEHLVVWDDLVLSKDLKPVENYYIRARKMHVSVVFLSQTYYDIPKNVRKNSSYLVLLNLGGSKREQTAILNEWSSDLSKEELNYIYNDATAVELRPLIIEGGKSAKNRKYRKGWNDFYNPKEFCKDMPIVNKRTGKRIIMKPIEYSSSDSDSSDY
jgi:hypothetical protein